MLQVMALNVLLQQTFGLPFRSQLFPHALIVYTIRHSHQVNIRLPGYNPIAVNKYYYIVYSSRFLPTFLRSPTYAVFKTDVIGTLYVGSQSRRPQAHCCVAVDDC